MRRGGSHTKFPLFIPHTTGKHPACSYLIPLQKHPVHTSYPNAAGMTRWMYLNDEKQNPTLEMLIVKCADRGNTIAWKARRLILEGQEFTFNYGCACAWD